MSGPLDFDPPAAEPPPPPPPVRPVGPPPPARPPGATRFGWMVGVLVVVILAYIAVNTLRTDPLRAPSTGDRLHPFAAPLVLSSLEGDANVALKPDSGGAGSVPACSVHRRDVLNVCDLYRRGPLVLGFLFTRGAKCTGAFDAMQRIAATTPGVAFAGVVLKGDRDKARELVRSHGWTFPVAFDHDGALANVNGVNGCPQVTLVYPGGVVRETLLGRDRAERDLRTHVTGLVAGSRRRGWRPPA